MRGVGMPNKRYTKLVCKGCRSSECFCPEIELKPVSRWSKYSASRKLDRVTNGAEECSLCHARAGVFHLRYCANEICPICMIALNTCGCVLVRYHVNPCLLGRPHSNGRSQGQPESVNEKKPTAKAVRNKRQTVILLTQRGTRLESSAEC